MTITINRIPLVPVLKIGFMIYFLMAFIGLLLYSTIILSVIGTIGSLIGGLNLPMAMPGGGSMIFIGLFGAIFIAIIYTILTMIVVLIYNAASSFAGGIEVDVESSEMDSLRERVNSLHSDMIELQNQNTGLITPEEDNETVSESQ
ncbi:MAG: hypothetical protein P9L92_19235 [Candidatus Electryonea clarkiae]|nr:hypothetical protein [Candidatus Electryonea clarkiae]MDP8287394.1 hypothetical protein [Candidatus Electryonea clarkiae]